MKDLGVSFFTGYDMEIRLVTGTSWPAARRELVPDTVSGPLRENVLKCGVVRPLFEQFESAKLSEK